MRVLVKQRENARRRRVALIEDNGRTPLLQEREAARFLDGHLELKDVGVLSLYRRAPMLERLPHARPGNLLLEIDANRRARLFGGLFGIRRQIEAA